MSRFAAWALPTGTDARSASVGAAGVEVHGVEVAYPAADGAWLGQVVSALCQARATVTARGVRDIVTALGAAGHRFLHGPLREEALSLLVPTAGLSAPMASTVLDGMAADWSAERLAELVAREFGTPRALDAFATHAGGDRTLPVGPRLCVQVLSGSVPGVGVNALIRSLLVKGPTLLKPGLGDVVLPVLFARALREVDARLADALAVVYWPGGSEELEDAALSAASVVTAYGDDAVVDGLRRRTPITTRFIAYHHRWSVGLVGRGALTPDALSATATEVARAVAMFDQRGCVSPRAIFVEQGGETGPAAFAAALAGAFHRLEAELPGGRLEADETAALQQLRGTAEMLAASGAGTDLYHGGDASWTVVYDPGAEISASCVGRVVRVVPIESADRLPALLAPAGAHVQTVGHAGLTGDVERLAEALGRAGVSRLAAFAAVAFPPPWWHHDGGGPLRDLVRWVDVADG